MGTRKDAGMEAATDDPVDELLEEFAVHVMELAWEEFIAECDKFEWNWKLVDQDSTKATVVMAVKERMWPKQTPKRKKS